MQPTMIILGYSIKTFLQIFFTSLKYNPIPTFYISSVLKQNVSLSDRFTENKTIKETVENYTACPRIEIEIEINIDIDIDIEI